MSIHHVSSFMEPLSLSAAFYLALMKSDEEVPVLRFFTSMDEEGLRVFYFSGEITVHVFTSTGKPHTLRRIGIRVRRQEFVWLTSQNIEKWFGVK